MDLCKIDQNRVHIQFEREKYILRNRYFSTFYENGVCALLILHALLTLADVNTDMIRVPAPANIPMDK